LKEIRLKRKYLLPLVALTFLSTWSARTPQAILKDVDALVSFNDSDFSAEYTIIQDKPGVSRSTTVFAVFRRDADNKYVIIILKPDISKGQGYLKLDNTLWFYDPTGRRFNSTSARDKFQNTNARNSDFTRSTLSRDYDITGTSTEKLGIHNCLVMTLKANNNEVTYPGMKIWISEENLVLKSEDYSLSGQLLRTTLIPEYQKAGTKYFPAKILIIDQLLGAKVDGKFVHEKTQITISKISLKQLPDTVFTKKFLEGSQL
jgi:outer membrane lipoprotein-sorting protein